MGHDLTSWNWYRNIIHTCIYNHRCWINSAGINHMFNPSWFLFKRPIVLCAYTVLLLLLLLLLFACVSLVLQSVMAVQSTPRTVYNNYVLNLSVACPRQHPVAAVYSPQVRRQVRFRTTTAVSSLWSFGMWRRTVWTIGTLRKGTWRYVCLVSSFLLIPGLRV